MDYAIRRGISLSTLRRYIKAKKLHYKIENGKYLLLDTSKISDEFGESSEKLEKLEKDLKKAQEEITELKMLVAIYEEKISPLRFGN